MSINSRSLSTAHQSSILNRTKLCTELYLSECFRLSWHASRVGHRGQMSLGLNWRLLMSLLHIAEWSTALWRKFSTHCFSWPKSKQHVAVHYVKTRHVSLRERCRHNYSQFRLKWTWVTVQYGYLMITWLMACKWKIIGQCLAFYDRRKLTSSLLYSFPNVITTNVWSSLENLAVHKVISGNHYLWC